MILHEIYSDWILIIKTFGSYCRDNYSTNETWKKSFGPIDLIFESYRDDSIGGTNRIIYAEDPILNITLSTEEVLNLLEPKRLTLLKEAKEQIIQEEEKEKAEKLERERNKAANIKKSLDNFKQYLKKEESNV